MGVYARRPPTIPTAVHPVLSPARRPHRPSPAHQPPARLLGPSRLGNYSNGRTMYKHSTRNRPLVLEPWNWKLVCIQIETFISEIVCATTLEIISIFTYFGNVFSDSVPLGKKNMLRSLCIKIATPRQLSTLQHRRCRRLDWRFCLLARWL